jgi:hypothetical protein
MKKNSHTSQDYDRKHGQDHISHNPRAIKDMPNTDDNGASPSEKTAELISQGHTIANKPPLKSNFTEDKRETARHEHTNHFTNRASEGEN